MRLSDRVENKIVQAIESQAKSPTGEIPDHEFFIVQMPHQGLRVMVMIILPVNEEDNTAQMDDIDPYATQGEFDTLVSRLWITARMAQNGVQLDAAPGLTKRASGIVVPR